MQPLISRTTVGLCRRSNINFIGSAQHRWWFRALVRGDARTRAASTHPNQLLEHLSRLFFNALWTTGVKSDKLSKRGYTTFEGPVYCMEKLPIANSKEDIIESNEIWAHTEDDTKRNDTAAEEIWYATILQNSSHRDGTIYKKSLYWGNNYLVDVTDHEETRVEPMRFSVATADCYPSPDCCGHLPRQMVQIFSLKLAKAPINSGLLQLYGYIAARDDVDSRLNFVFNRTRDDPIIVQQGSLIGMTGPKRGIALISDVLFEFDMKIKNGNQEENDLQLIDGVTIFYEGDMPWTPFTVRINGDSGAIDMSLTNVYCGVEATVELIISQVEKSFDLSLCCVVSMMEAHEEFQLFGGSIGEPCGLRRFVIAVLIDSVMHLKFKVDQKGSNVVEHCCSFEAKLHGCASHEIKLDIASLGVKVTWSVVIE